MSMIFDIDSSSGQPALRLDRRAFLGGLAALPLATALPARAQSGGALKVGLHKAMIASPALLLAEELPDWSIELLYFSAPADMAAALVAGSLDLGYTGLTIAAIGRSKGQPLTVISNAAERGSAIMVRTESTATSLADLKGKKIGTQPGGIQDILLREELAKANVGLDEVELVRLSYADMPLALSRGDVDAYSGNEPNSTQAIIDGYAKVLLYPYENPVGGINLGIVTTDSVVAGKPDMLRTLVGAHEKAVKKLSDDPDTWASLVSGTWGFDVQTIRRAADNVALRTQMDEQFVSSYSAYIDRLEELKLLSPKPDMAKLVDRQFLPS